jgi:hypothetical protein
MGSRDGREARQGVQDGDSGVEALTLRGSRASSIARTLNAALALALRGGGLVGEEDQLAWLSCHAEALKRLGGVPATMRIDNEKTAIATGAGVHDEIHIAYPRLPVVS